MPRKAVHQSRASYGVDAPGFLLIAAAASAAYVIWAIASHKFGSIVGATMLLSCVGFSLHTSLRGKFIVWDELLERLKLRGDERILDLGCGRGAVLLLAAKRLSTGRAFGVDIWSRKDQSGNSPNATRSNAQLEGVQTRVELVTGDATSLPFQSNTFDLIVSNVAIHNIKGQLARRNAIDEAVRVLRPGGRIILADLKNTGAYAARLETLGMMDVKRRGLGWRMWWGGPWVPTRLVAATKLTEAER